MNSQAPQTRERIFSAALKLFAERGQASVSMREIAEAADVSKPMLYYYFDSKDGLIRQLFNDSLEAVQKRVENVDAQVLPPEKKVAAIIEQVLDSADGARAKHKLLVDFASDPALIRDHLDNLQNYFVPMRAITARIIAEGQAKGMFRGDFDPETAATLLFGVTNIFIGQYMRTGHPKLCPELAHTLTDLVIHGFAGNGSRPQGTDDV